MNGLVAVAMTVGVAAACSPAGPGEDPGGDPTRVQTASGALQGVADGDVVRFRGVPYAQPPVGELRWAPPVPVTPWSAVRAADRSGPPCAQSAPPPAGPQVEEDCLHLDVTVPARPAAVPRPVMVWLHGGGFSTGAGSDHDPRRLAAQGDVVVVTVDFRLGTFGYLALPGMIDPGSYGLQDQQAALAWVRRNAAAFGGDPANITLFGQSGGAVAVCGQLTSPAARGLFDKAILQSGSCGTTLAAGAAGPGSPAFGAFWRPMAHARRTGISVAENLGCTDPTTRLACLRGVPADRLLAQPTPVTAAATGDSTLPVDPRDALRSGRFADVPVLSGHTADEQRFIANLFALLGQPVTAAAYPELIATGFGEDADAVLGEYPLASYPDAASAWTAVHTDSGYVCPQLDTTAALATRGPVFGYEFADPTAPPTIPDPTGTTAGATHASELFYLFDQPGKPVRADGSVQMLTPVQRQVADTMIAAWTTFARTGAPPTGPGAWPAWHGLTSAVHVFTADPGRPTRADPAARHHCAFWAGLGR